MDINGMLPAHNCKQCGKPLNADGGHPAELYAGTYTGLCYSCERSDERLIKTDPLDGCQTWEFPPHSPAWRRTRERFLGFTGCKTCSGKGRLWIGRADSQGGSYTQQCPDCSARYWSHPLRLWESRRWGTIRKAAENLYHKELKRFGAVGVHDYNATLSKANAEVEAGLKRNSLWEKYKGMMHDVNLATDNGVRQAVYLAARESGLPEHIAVEKAFEIINFRTRVGNAGLAASARHVVFLNSFYSQTTITIYIVKATNQLSKIYNAKLPKVSTMLNSLRNYGVIMLSVLRPAGLPALGGAIGHA